MDPAFERAKERIPPFLRAHPDIRFNAIHNGEKCPAPGVSARWDEPGGRNYGIDDPIIIGYLAEGHNYGVCCGFSDLAVADIEDIARLEELGIAQRIPEAPTVKTGRKTGLGRHFYLICPDLESKIILYDPVLKDQDDEPLHLGEIQSHGCQVVGPGSRHPSGNSYEVIKDLPIPTITKADLLKIFDGLIIEDTTEEPPEEVQEPRKRSSGCGASLGDNVPIDAVAYPVKVKEHHGSETQGSHPKHGSTTGKNFSINTHKNTWHCFRHKTGGDSLVWLAVDAGLIRCEDALPGCMDDKELFKQVLQIARDRGFYIPDMKPKSNGQAKSTGLTVIDAIKALAGVCDGATSKDGMGFNKFEREKYEDIIKRALTGYLSSEEEDIAYRIAKNHKKQLAALHFNFDEMGHIPRDDESENGQPMVEEIPQDIQAKALEILEHSDPLGYMLDTFNESHVGDRQLAESQFVSFGLQSALNTKGIVDGWEGPSGMGKSDACKACVRQLPKEYAFTRTVTAKSLYMHGGELLPGMIIFMDDVPIEAGSDLEATIKRAHTFFQEGAEHETLDAQRKLLVVKLPPRLLFLRTNVDSRAADSQLANRSLGLPVDSSPEIDEKVCDNVLSLAEEGKTSDSLTRNVLICREMWRDIKTNIYRVKMQEIKTLVEILSKKNRRNPSVFTDMVAGLACIRHRQRDRERGENGEMILYAAYQDYIDAAKVFNHHAAYLGCRLDPSERAVIRYLMSLKEESATIGDIHSFLRLTFPNDGWSDTGTRRLILGRKERNTGGLLEKCADIEPIDGINKSGRSVRRYKWTGSRAAFELYDTGAGVKVYSPEEKGIDQGLPKFSHLFPRMGKPQNDNSSPTDSPTLPNIPKDIENGEMKRKVAQGVDLSGESGPSKPVDGELGKPEENNNVNESEDIDFEAYPSMGNDGKTWENVDQRKDPKIIASCLVCGADIGSGHGSYFGRFCSSCGPAWSMVKAAAKSLQPGFTTSQIYEELAKRGRPPLIEYIPIMLRDLGYFEESGNWR